MDEIVKCTVLGIGSVALGFVEANPSGREVWTGVRVETADGGKRFFPGMVVEAEPAMIIKEAMESGETIELWLSGKTSRAYPYAVRTATDAWYGNDYARHIRRQSRTMLFIGILMLPFLGLGVLGLLAALTTFMSSFTFAARHCRQTFDLGYAAGVLGEKPGLATTEVPQIA